LAQRVFECRPATASSALGRKAMPWVVRYVGNQRAHHAKRKTYERLERVEIEKRKPVKTGSGRDERGS